MRSHQVPFVCADDAHGTPHHAQGTADGDHPEAMIAAVSEEHQSDFAGFNISFDNYHSTHSDENRGAGGRDSWPSQRSGKIKIRTISQLFDPGKVHVPAGSLRQGHLSQVQVPRPVR